MRFWREQAYQRYFQGDIVLISLRDFQDGKADVILKYNADEARQLKAYGELPESAKINESAVGEGGSEDDMPFEFDADAVGSEEEEESEKEEVDIDDL